MTKLDFFRIAEKATKEGTIEIYPDFLVVRSKDLMVRSKSFYAIWDEEKGLWSTDEYDVQRLVDQELWEHREKVAKRTNGTIRVNMMKDFGSGAWKQFRQYLANLSDSSVQLDENLTFSNTEVKKTDYVSRRLDYPLEEGDISAYTEVFETLYEPEELEKLEWTIGAIISGDARHIQKFLVLYGPPGSGKGTWITLLMLLFMGYYTTFEAKSLTQNNNSFATEVFRNNPLLAIQHDGDLSKIEDNSKLNSIIAHEEMTMNEKFKAAYTSAIIAFLVMGTNSPVKITDAKSGIIRRLIDVHPSGRKLAPRKYQALMSQLSFELGAIAHHCLGKYREMGRDYYEGYRAVEMMLQTDVFYNYIENYFDIFKEQDGVTLSSAYEMYKVYCDESGIDYRIPKFKFREELRNYFQKFEERAMVDEVRVRSWYSGFRTDKFKIHIAEEMVLPLVMEETESLFDGLMADQPAQYVTANDTPVNKWVDVTTKLSELDTTKTHYVKVPENHIVIDFDLKDEDGNKSPELNLEAASRWPATYSEYSKGGGGIHLHYHYAGDPSELSSYYAEDIEVKVFTGNSSLRRRLSKCNNVPVAVISSGLPLKEKKVINATMVKSEQGLRSQIERNLRKEIHPGTKPSVDFIHKILEDAYSQGLAYDVTDMRPMIIAFAAGSTNQPEAALKLVSSMKWKSEHDTQMVTPEEEIAPDTDKVVFFDIEVYPNLFLISWKYEDSDTYVHMINPKPHEVEALFRFKLVGFNNRRYDNHILYAAANGANNAELYRISQNIMNKQPGASFAAAYNLSYTDIFDFTSKKQSLKKYEVELGIPHKELNIPWDQPVPENLWKQVQDYCDNDVMATEATFKARKADFTARRILAELAELSVNTTTQNLTAKIIFGDNKTPQKSFEYTNLSEDLFPGYEFKLGRSTYKGLKPSEGGYVYAEPGMYTNVAVLDVTSMHPTSIINMNAFGPYTKVFKDILDARVAIKNGEFDRARKMFDGRLEPYLVGAEDDATLADELSYALKIAVNIVYGLTSASFPNAFKDPRNKDNFVAKRGALFMIDLQLAVQEQIDERTGKPWIVAHIKTDSIKIPDATPEIIEFVMEFGRKYGYNFEHEATYEKMTLVNDAVYIAKVGWAAKAKKIGTWEAVGAQFQHPFVFKTLFSHEPIVFRDMCEVKSVTSALYLDFTDVTKEESVDKGDLHFVGKTGMFTPILEGKGGGLLVREKDDKFYAASNTKGYRWLESHDVEVNEKQDDIDMGYFRELIDEAAANLGKYGDLEWFLDEDGKAAMVHHELWPREKV